MSAILYAMADTVPLWRLPVIALLFLVIIGAFELMFWALRDD